MEEREKLNPKGDVESRKKFFKRFDCTDTLLTETEKQAVENILVEYHDIFARHRMDIGTNTEFKLRLTPKDVKAVYSQSLPMPIHLEEDLIVELALMHKYGLSQSYPSQNTQVPVLRSEKPTGNYVSSWILES